MQKTIPKMVSVLEILVFECVAVTYLCYEVNSRERQSTCYQIVLRSQMWLREMLSNCILFWINVKLGWKCRHGKFVSVWEPWTRSFAKGVLKRKLSGIQVTTFFGVNNFENIWAMKLIFCLEMLKSFCTFRKRKKTWRKCVSFSR